MAISPIPQRIFRLEELANNLWWSWNYQARNLFASLDSYLWDSTGHNPVKQLINIKPEKLQAAAGDPGFLSHYDSVMLAYDDDVDSKESWALVRYPEMKSAPIAYFSFEFAIHSSLPMYAGGLGILAGDIIKESSDAGLPLVGLGFMYPEGYFQQQLNSDGWQEELYSVLYFDEAPIKKCKLPDEFNDLVQIQLADRPLFVDVWQVQVGRSKVYLLDTNVLRNSPQDRQLSARLYTANQEQRIQQEIVLGMAGVKVLKALEIKPAIWHANEGHAAFMMLERVKDEVKSGKSFWQAVDRVKAGTIFTTHTPIPAGTDIFPIDLIDKYFSGYWPNLGIDRETFLRLGRKDERDLNNFNMTALSLKLSGHCNAVSKLHGEVARKMWNSIWPDLKEKDVPITYVTNGVHVPSWVAPELADIYRKYLGPVWKKRHFDHEIVGYVMEIPDEELWEVRKTLRRKLIHVILDRAQERWAKGQASAQQVLAMGALLEVDVLTIVFVRRFAEYKRPALIFQDIERLKKIVTDRFRPVQIIFAGKSHPADTQSKHLLRQVYSLAADRQFQGRIAFVEGYDMHLAKFLVQGADVWLNNPRRLQEACGTSGMKASMNGIPNLSILDGWWLEGYNGANGWAVTNKADVASEESDKTDAESIYRILEQEVVPLFYDRDTRDVPREWIKVSKEAIKSIMPAFCARRMLKDYIEKMYLPALKTIAESNKSI
jgi:starch phosphorylase